MLTHGLPLARRAPAVRPRHALRWSTAGSRSRRSGPQGSHLIGDLAESDALIVVPESVTSVEAGETVTVLPLDEDF